MDLFYTIVLSVALVLLIIILAIIGIGMKKNGGQTGPWPPIESTCPDYWQIDGGNNCIIPKPDPRSPNMPPRNTGTMYTSPDYTTLDNSFTSTNAYNSTSGLINFSDPFYTNCSKKTWAKKWGVYWDGYSNYNGCPT
jgi:hypothetical protein